MNKETKKRVTMAANLQAAEIMRERLEKNNDFNPEEMAKAYRDAATIKRVEVHIHGTGCKVSIGSINKHLSEEAKETLRKYGRDMSLCVFPELDRKINSIGASLRNEIGKYRLAGTSLMDITTLKEEFFPVLRKKQEEIEEMKASLATYYDKALNEFREAVNSLCDETCVSNGEKKTIMDSVGQITNISYDTYMSRIGIDLDTDFTDEELSGETSYDKEVGRYLSEMKRQAAIQQGVSLVKDFIQRLWAGLVDYITSVDDVEDLSEGKRVLNARNKLRKESERIKRENIYGIPIVTEIAEKAISIAKNVVKDETIDDTFSALATIWGQSKDFGMGMSIPEKAPSWLTAEAMESEWAEMA